MDYQNTTLDDIASIVGFSATLRLAAWFGAGGRMHVPKEAKPDHVITRLVGESAAKRLCKTWPGQTIQIATLSLYDYTVDRQMVKRMVESGFSTKEMSIYMRMSERRVQMICRELEVEGIIPVMRPQKND